MGLWGYAKGDASIRIDTDELSRQLCMMGRGPVDSLAKGAFNVAAEAVTDVRAQTFIGYLEAAESPVGVRGFQLESEAIPDLSRMLRIPVALVINDSNYAAEMETGSVERPGDRPLTKAYYWGKGRRGVTGMRSSVRSTK